MLGYQISDGFSIADVHLNVIAPWNNHSNLDVSMVDRGRVTIDFFQIDRQYSGGFVLKSKWIKPGDHVEAILCLEDDFPDALQEPFYVRKTRPTPSELTMGMVIDGIFVRWKKPITYPDIDPSGKILGGGIVTNIIRKVCFRR